MPNRELLTVADSITAYSSHRSKYFESCNCAETCQKSSLFFVNVAILISSDSVIVYLLVYSDIVLSVFCSIVFILIIFDDFSLSFRPLTFDQNK